VRPSLTAMDYFQPARLRVDRAIVRTADMAAVWNDYLELDPFDFELRREMDTQWVLAVVQRKPFPAELPLLFGEWLHNLRSALDYIVWATAIHVSGQVPPPSEGDLQYPIYDSRDAWIKNLRRLRPLADHHREMLLHMQPFNSDRDANFLGWINRLARIDRHRTLIDWTARLVELKPLLSVPSGVIPRMEWGSRVMRGGVCEFARITFPTTDDAEGFAANPRMGIDPEISEWGVSEFWGTVRFSERLNLLNLFVRAELGTYEYDCTGESSHEALTDDFKAKSDERRVARGTVSVVRAASPPVEWVDAGSPKGVREGEQWEPLLLFRRPGHPPGWS